jgi:hypothetical protein
MVISIYIVRSDKVYANGCGCEYDRMHEGIHAGDKVSFAQAFHYESRFSYYAGSRVSISFRGKRSHPITPIPVIWILYPYIL